MSGGHFDYDQYKLKTIADSIQSFLDKRGKLKKHENDEFENFYENFVNELSNETIEKMKIGVRLLKEAEIYAHRIDWLLSGDDEEDTFNKRLSENLKKLNEK